MHFGADAACAGTRGAVGRPELLVRILFDRVLGDCERVSGEFMFQAVTGV